MSGKFAVNNSATKGRQSKFLNEGLNFFFLRFLRSSVFQRFWILSFGEQMPQLFLLGIQIAL